MKRILVTGATGFTGSHLCQALKDDYQVIALVRNPDKAIFLKGEKIEIKIADFTQPETLKNVCQGIDTVFHVASAYREGKTTAKLFYAANVKGTEILLDDAISCGVKRFVYCSTVGVHGNIKLIPADELAPIRPNDLYQQSKFSAEKLVQSKKELIETTIIRPVGIYGPGDFRLLKLFRLIKNGTFKMIGNGRHRYQLTYIDDLIQAMILAAKSSQAIGQVFIIGGNDCPTLLELTQTIASMMNVSLSKFRLPYWPVFLFAFACEMICLPLGIEPPLFRRRLEFFSNSRCFSIAKAKKYLNFSPQISLKEGLARTIYWYQQNQYL
jgi:nucleoside-diphosphate-sugar epimerase